MTDDGGSGFEPADEQPTRDAEPTDPEAPKTRRLTTPVLAMLAIAGVLLLAVAVSGTALALGAFTSPAGPSESPTPIASEPVEPSATPTPEPMPIPETVLVAECSDLVSSGALDAALDSNVKAARVWHPDYTSAALAQAGGMSCSWSKTGRPDDSWNTGVLFTVLPDAAGDYDRIVGDVADHQYYVIDTVGDRSWFYCSNWAKSHYCSGNILVDGFWAEVALNDRDGKKISDEKLEGRMQSLLTSISDSIESSPTRAAWEPADSAFDGRIGCSDGGAIIRDAFGWKKVAETGFDDYGIGAALWSRVEFCVHVESHSAEQYVTFQTTPSGAWAIEQMRDDAPIDGVRGAFSEVAIPGTDLAFVACDSYGCAAQVSYGLSQVHVDATSMKRDKFVEAVTNLIAAFETEG